MSHWNYAFVEVVSYYCSPISWLDPTGASYAQGWGGGVVMITIPKSRGNFTIFDVICDYTLNRVNFTKTSGAY